MKLATRQLLVGRRIVDVELHPFDDGRGGVAYGPVLIFDNGARLTFSVTETESQVYGVTPEYHPKRTRPTPPTGLTPVGEAPLLCERCSAGHGNLRIVRCETDACECACKLSPATPTCADGVIREYDIDEGGTICAGCGRWFRRLAGFRAHAAQAGRTRASASRRATR